MDDDTDYLSGLFAGHTPTEPGGDPISDMPELLATLQRIDYELTTLTTLFSIALAAEIDRRGFDQRQLLKQAAILKGEASP